MVISNLSIIKNANFVTLAADISFRGKKTQRAYISVDNTYENFLATDASPFLAAVLLPCMKTGENIYVEDNVSNKLLENTDAIMDLVSGWKVGLKKIKVRVKETTRDTSQPHFVGSFFTAGVDSFYTYLKHNKKEKDTITHLIMVHGFDIPLSNITLFQEVKATVGKVQGENC